MKTNDTAATVVSADQIIAFVDRIAAGFKPCRIVLFGSHACGSPTPDSDVDLLITRRRWSMSPLTAAGKIRVQLGVPFALDLIVPSEADVRRRIAGGMTSCARSRRLESHSMRPMTREWVAKAESDYDGACEALRWREKSRRDRICFFSQQCIEKYLKARLTEAGVAFPRTHELSILLRLCLPSEPKWAAFDPALAAMTQFAVLIRYPGTWATLSEARHGIRTCRLFRRRARQAFGLRP